MAELCVATTHSGQRCRIAALPGSTWCFSHDPERQAERDAARRAGGRNKATAQRTLKSLPPELADLVGRLRGWLDAVESGALAPGQAQAVATLCARVLDICKFGHELGAARELEARIAELETRLSEGVRR